MLTTNYKYSNYCYLKTDNSLFNKEATQLNQGAEIGKLPEGMYTLILYKAAQLINARHTKGKPQPVMGAIKFNLIKILI